MSEGDANALERAVIRLLRPLVRLVLRRGMAYGQFAELAKRAYVEAVRRDFAVPGRKLTISRVAVLTGLTRKEARRLMQTELEGDADGSDRRRINRAARVVSAWVEESAYHDDAGTPVALAYESDRGPSFSSLVSDHGADVTPRAVLDELLRVGTVERLDDGRIRLLQRAYIPRLDEAAKLTILGTDVSDLIASIEHNLDPAEREPFFQRKVAYDHLPAEYLPKLRALLRRRGQALLEELNEDMAQHDRDAVAASAGQEEAARDEGDRHRAMIGVYYFEEELADDSAADRGERPGSGEDE